MHTKITPSERPKACRLHFMRMILTAALIMTGLQLHGSEWEHVEIYLRNNTGDEIKGVIHNQEIQPNKDPSMPTQTIPFTSAPLQYSRIMDWDCEDMAWGGPVKVLFNKTSSYGAFSVSGTVKYKYVSQYDNWYYFETLTVRALGKVPKEIVLSPLGAWPWTKSVKLSDLGVNIDQNENILKLHWEHGARSRLYLTMDKIDRIRPLQGQWYTDTIPRQPLYIDVIPAHGLYKLSLVPGATSKNWGRYTSLTYYGVPVGNMIEGRQIRYNINPPLVKIPGNSITYKIDVAKNGSVTLLQKSCGGFPTEAKAASIKWWKNAIRLTR